MVMMMSASEYGEGAVVELLGHQHHKGKVSPPGGDDRRHLDQPEAGERGERPSALVVAHRRSSLAARVGRRRWTNGGRAGGQCLDSGAVFCLNSETVKAVCAGWRGHYQLRLLEGARVGG